LQFQIVIAQRVNPTSNVNSVTVISFAFSQGRKSTPHLAGQACLLLAYVPSP
jgi:hypothetical protein